MATVVSVCYLALFLAVGLAAARRALPQEGAPVLVPLGCGFGVSLLALVPAALAVVLGLTQQRFYCLLFWSPHWGFGWCAPVPGAALNPTQTARPCGPAWFRCAC